MYLGSPAYRPATAYTQQINTTRQTQLGYCPQAQLPATTTKQAFGEILNNPGEFFSYMRHRFGNNPIEDAATLGSTSIVAAIDTIGEIPHKVVQAIQLAATGASLTTRQINEIKNYFEGPGNHHVEGLLFGLKVAASPLYALGGATEVVIINPASRMIADAFKQARRETTEETIERFRTTMSPEHFAEIMAYVNDYNTHKRAVSREAKRAEYNLNRLSNSRNRGPYEQYLPDQNTGRGRR
jgi:hypothetical protein